MATENAATMPKEVHDVLVARWEGFRTLARKLPDHHVLAVELIRTLNDETVAVFTIVRDGEPVRTVVTGDSRGRVKSVDCDHHIAQALTHALAWIEAKLHPDDGPATQPGAKSAPDSGADARMAIRAAVDSGGAVPLAAMAAPDSGGADPAAVALGQPPPREPPEPGIIAVGGSLLASAFDVAEFVEPSGT